MPSSVLVLVLGVVGILASAAFGILVVTIIGIHRGDGRLANEPKSHSEAFARRMLTGVRYSRGNAEEENL